MKIEESRAKEEGGGEGESEASADRERRKKKRRESDRRKEAYKGGRSARGLGGERETRSHSPRSKRSRWRGGGEGEICEGTRKQQR